MPTIPRRSLAALTAGVLVSASVLATAPAAFAADDTTPPTVVIESPADGTVFDANGAWVWLTVTDDSGAAPSWQVLIDDVLHYSGSSSGRTGVNLFVGHIPNGPHTLTVKAVDGSGNEGSVTRSFSVDYLEPVVQIARPQDGAWVRADEMVIEYGGTDSLGWTVRADGATIRSDGGYSGASFSFTPSGWADGSTHTIEVTGQDSVGRSATRSVSVRADAAAPVVAIDPLPVETLTRAHTLSGTVSDAASGVASVQVSFATRDGATCGGTAFSGWASIDGGTWSLAVPAAAADGDYCVIARAADAVGNTADSAAASVTLDVTGPLAPTGLAPAGELREAPATLSWAAVSDAASYQYRLWDDPWSMDSATPVDAATVSATLPLPLAGTWFWQVRGIDEFGNVGAWSDLAEFSVLDTPQLAVCDALCRVIGDTVPVEWDPFPGAVEYTVQVTGTDSAGDPVVVEQAVDGSATDTVVSLPSTFPTGTITVRLRAELDHEVAGSAYTNWSEPLNYLRFAAPGKPALLSPAPGAYVDGDDVSLAWTDDSSVVLWELRISLSPDLDEEGGLVDEEGGTGAALIDPMFLVVFLVGNLDDIPDGIRLDEIDALADCQSVLDFLESTGQEEVVDVPCADGAITIPTTVPDGSYYWQVRGIGFGALSEGESAGPWSDVGRFTVGDAPVVPQPGGAPVPSGPKTHGVPSTTDPDAGQLVAEPVAEPSHEPTPSDEGSASGSGADGGEAASDSPDGDAEAAPDGGFPVGWLIGGIVALVVLAGGGALVTFLLRRR
jgi:hypothetical protein